MTLAEIFTRDAANNWRNFNDRLNHLETLGQSSGAPVSGSGLSLAIDTKTANFTFALTDFNILCDASGGAFTGTLPAAADAYNSTTKSGRIYNIIKADNGANTVTLQADGVELIYSISSPAGSNTLIITNAIESITVQSNGTAWYVW